MHGVGTLRQQMDVDVVITGRYVGWVDVSAWCLLGESGMLRTWAVGGVG